MAEVSSGGECAACGRWHRAEAPCSTLVRADAEGGGTPRNRCAPTGEEVDPLVGQRFGSFHLVRRLGRGGMGSVYLGEHVSIGSKVAVKVLHDHLAMYPELVQRFHAEARAVNLIGHENIVSIFDLNAALPRPYLIMEYLDGAPLSAWVGTPLPAAAVVAVLSQVCDALQAAHARGIVHRDLKPDNVFLVRRGRGSPFVKVLDFGIAKLLDAHMPQTHAGIIVGTPEYMAPEQSVGRRLDGRADLYAVGVIAYQLVTGRLPFTDEGITAQLVAHQTRLPPPPRSVHPGVSPAVERVILRALAKAPEDRYPSASALRSALQGAIAEDARAAEAGALGATPPARAPTPSGGASREQAQSSPVAPASEPPGQGRAPSSPAVPGAETPRARSSPAVPGAETPRARSSPAVPGSEPPGQGRAPSSPGTSGSEPPGQGRVQSPPAAPGSETPGQGRTPSSPSAPGPGGGDQKGPDAPASAAPPAQAATPSRPRTVELPVQVVLRQGEAPVRLTGSDLSRGGLFLRSEGSLPPLCARLSVVLELESGPQSVLCEVVRQVPPEQARVWGMPTGFGVQFVEATAALKIAVDQLLKGEPVRRSTPGPRGDDAEAARVLEAWRQRSAGDHYAVLGLPPDADMETVRARTREAWSAMESLRQRPLSPSQRAQLDAVRVRVREAGDALGAPVQRALYDAERGNHPGVARCLEAGLTAEQLEPLRREFLARHPQAAGPARVHFLSGGGLERDGQLARALEHYERGLALDPLEPGLLQRYRVVRRALAARAAAVTPRNDRARSP
ncbi:protein kinase domain-containing protein [Pyxidicoccus sp. MSG2]|uniref:protein kinase domain-containing protein n=1 Tax=Pyxidicoccus sp. MSG2 TaxID=2996790 RepID=UPI0022702A47|nr:protein kinase [Pyxidicoccus sp. MSG2]MCY1016336.1 protein kinase [Pyxidicoccus sp. MSG2]